MHGMGEYCNHIDVVIQSSQCVVSYDPRVGDKICGYWLGWYRIGLV